MGIIRNTVLASVTLVAMPQKTELELNARTRRKEAAREFRQHLINASNELYLQEQLCLTDGRPFPESLRQAHAAIRAELRRLEEAEEEEERRAA